MLELALIVYYAVSVVYWLVCLKWKLTRPAFTGALLLCLPFLGLFLSLLQLLAERRQPLKGIERFKEHERVDHEDRIFERVDVKKEVNMVPLEEGLVVNDLFTRRRLLLDVLKEDIDQDMIPLLEQAVNNEDTETSHYAVTAVMEIKRKLMLSVQKWSVEYQNNKDDSGVVLEYAHAVKQYMTSGFMDRRMHNTYRKTYASLLSQLIESEARSEALFVEKLNCEMELANYSEALRVSELFRKHYPESEKAYVTALDLYYRLKMKEAFFETLEQLKALKIRVSNSALTIIRYWSAKGA
ncbi:hypothetical protein K0T92_08315 [Paenibacillus oenotherae]|uniref:Uncharacterized protein n=1 Tax=Paenibacillus oenotherae TaxID=1435645 RepID=A0ABS7D4M7_9BACL|nr:hypothetical protein [Paenibacillus oenotherae]MBW7474748.1 hypothetical protein [Paenibacillus oenotherae]